MGKNGFGCRFDDDMYEPLALGKRNLVQIYSCSVYIPTYCRLHEVIHYLQKLNEQLEY